MDIYELRAKRLSEAIERSGLSFVELERKTGVSKSSLQRYATGGTKKIPIDCLELIAQATGSDVIYLMGWEDEKAPSVPEGTKDEFINAIMELSEDEVRELRTFVHFLKYKRDHRDFPEE